MMRTENQTRYRRLVQCIGAIFLLVLVDQLTKLWALHLHSAQQVMDSSKVAALGLLIHLPDKSPLYYAISALVVIVATAVAPISRMVKVCWIAAGLSNHGEMILRHGSVDFLAFRLGDSICVANLADFYIAVGGIYLAYKIAGIVRRAKSWTDPIPANAW